MIKWFIRQVPILLYKTTIKMTTSQHKQAKLAFLVYLPKSS